jgi:hypothetical protein
VSRSSPSATALLHFSQHRCKTAPPPVSVPNCGRGLPNRLPRRSAPHIQWQRGVGHAVIVPPSRLTAKDLVGCVGGCSQQFIARQITQDRVECGAAILPVKVSRKKF